MKKKKMKFWWIWPQNEGAFNKIVSCSDKEAFHPVVKCTDGDHPMWLTKKDIVDDFTENKATQQLKFQAYVQEGGSGIIRPWSKDEGVGGGGDDGGAVGTGTHKKVSGKCSGKCLGCIKKHSDATKRRLLGHTLVEP